MYRIKCIWVVDDGPTGIPEEYPHIIGPFDTYERAEKVVEAMSTERWISGAPVYYNTNIRPV